MYSDDDIQDFFPMAEAADECDRHAVDYEPDNDELIYGPKGGSGCVRDFESSEVVGLGTPLGAGTVILKVSSYDFLRVSKVSSGTCPGGTLWCISSTCSRLDNAALTSGASIGASVIFLSEHLGVLRKA